MFWFALPALLFHKVAGTPFERLSDWTLYVGYEGSCLLLYGIVLAAVRWGSAARCSEAAICAFAASWGNVGYMGVPLLIAAYGEAAATAQPPGRRARHADPAEPDHPAACRLTRTDERRRVVTARTLTRVETPQPLHGFQIAASQNVHRPDQHRTTRALDPFDDVARRGPVLGCVELIPDRAAAGLHHLVDGMVSLLNTAEDLQRLLLLGRPRDRQRPLGVEQRAAGRQHDRRLPSRAEQIDAHIDLRGVDEPARAELVVRKPFPIRLQRRIVVHARGEVSPVRRRQGFLRRRLEFQDVDRLSGIGDDEVRRGRRCGGDVAGFRRT